MNSWITSVKMYNVILRFYEEQQHIFKKFKEIVKSNRWTSLYYGSTYKAADRLDILHVSKHSQHLLTNAITARTVISKSSTFLNVLRKGSLHLMLGLCRFRSPRGEAKIWRILAIFSSAFFLCQHQT